MRKVEKILMTYGLYVKISCYKYVLRLLVVFIERDFPRLLKTHFHFGSLGFETISF